VVERGEEDRMKKRRGKEVPPFVKKPLK